MKKLTTAQKNLRAKAFFAQPNHTEETMLSVLTEFGITPMTPDESGYNLKRTLEEAVCDLFFDQMVLLDLHFRTEVTV